MNDLQLPSWKLWVKLQKYSPSDGHVVQRQQSRLASQQSFSGTITAHAHATVRIPSLMHGH
jgi:hypothetical protein